MASGETPTYDLPYPLPTDPVDVAGDIQALAEQIDFILPSLIPPYHTLEIINNSGVSINEADPVYISGFNSIVNKPQVTKSDATNLNTFPVAGLAQSAIGNGSEGVIVVSGIFSGTNTLSFLDGDKLYTNVGGGITASQPVSGSGVVGIVAKSATSGIIIVGQSKGNGTWGSIKAGLS